MGALRDQLEAKLTEALVAGLADLTQDMAEESKRLAPESTGRAGNGLKVGEIRFEAEPRGLQKGEARSFNTPFGVARFGARSDITISRGKVIRGETHGSPGNILELRSTFRGRRAKAKASHMHEPGTLKRGIHATPPVVEGTRVIAGVRSEAPYSKPIEFGFLHRGGRKHTGKATQIKAKSFLRTPLKQRQVQGAAALARYIRRIG